MRHHEKTIQGGIDPQSLSEFIFTTCPTQKQLTTWLANQLKGSVTVGTEHREAESLLRVCLNDQTSPPHPPENSSTLSPYQLALIYPRALRRIAGEPLSRIRGMRGFWQDEFIISSATLDPRPETEGLVALSLALFKDSHTSQPARPQRLLDLGTGTGCVALSLLKEFNQAHGVGVDICPKALAIARLNGERLNLNHRCQWLLSDWGTNVSGFFDLIVSNPPYIASNHLATLPDNVRNYDPHLALDGGHDGLQPYTTLAAYAARNITQQGYVIFEIGHTQGLQVKNLLAHFMPYTHIIPDLAGKDRYVVGCYHAPLPSSLTPV